MAAGEKAPGAFRTIGEISTELGVPQHVLRYWETKFPQLRPLQRAGNRRYYRPAEVALVRRIHRLLNEEGYTMRGAQKLLESSEGISPPDPPQPAVASAEPSTSIDLNRLMLLRDRLRAAIAG